jgi:hypothetical protein
MRRKGFSFPCPMLGSSKDEAFQRFLKTTEVDPDKIYNPFPQIADPDHFNQAFTNPLVRMVYLPTTQPNIYHSEFRGLITTTHELAHIHFDATPAKILARLYLLDAYFVLTTLINLEYWRGEIWQTLDKVNTHLSASSEAITLSEELIAMAFTFNAVSSCEELEKMEKKSVKIYQEISSNFAALYYNTFKKIMGWVPHENVSLDIVRFLGLFLQGIQVNRYNGYPEVVDSYGRCKMLAEKVKTMKNGQELQDWFLHTHQTYHQDELHVWLEALAKLVDNYGEWSEEASCLWTLMQGRKPPKRVSDTFEFAKRAAIANRTSSRVQITFYAQESDRGWFIVPMIPYYGKGSKTQQKAVMSLYARESLRQQLDAGIGIYCPYYRPGLCVCSIPWREILWRLSRWAREGKFGAGEWRDLPPECSCGL